MLDDFLGALASSTLPAEGLHKRSGGVYGRACDGRALARIYTTYAYHLLRKFAVLGFAFVARGRKAWGFTVSEGVGYVCIYLLIEGAADSLKRFGSCKLGCRFGIWKP